MLKFPRSDKLYKKLREKVKNQINISCMMVRLMQMGTFIVKVITKF